MPKDYISREEAIKALVNLTVYNSSADIKSLVESKYYYQGEWIGGVKDALEEIKNIPAADVVERKRGEWVGYPESFKFEHIYDRDAIVCPFCEVSWNFVDNDTERFNFCPNCGADMREKGNG
ncbi:MAG: hypothetical protein IJP43_06085 [Oscillospiraceae bacterium]|nr:hypothetical protein [Oscillospiraceae bacterium]